MNKVMKSLAGVFSLWGRKQANGASSKTENGSTTNSTWLGEQRTSDFKKRIKQRQDEERKRLEKWKKEFKKITGDALTLTADGECDVLVQNTSKVRVFVTAKRNYKVGNLDGVIEVGLPSEDRLDQSIRDFISLGKQ